MAQNTWVNDGQITASARPKALKIIIPAIVILVALGLLVRVALTSGQYFLTIDEYDAAPAKYAGRVITLSGFVIGDSIEFIQVDAQTSRLEFDIADAAYNPSHVVHVVAINEPIPDQMQHEAQAIVDGQIGEDGALYAEPGKVLVKCPTRYEELQESGVEQRQPN